MRRISTDMSNNDLQYHLRIQESQMNRVQNQMGDQKRIQDLRDDPVAAAHATRYQSLVARMDQFSKNVEAVQSHLRVAEGYMKSANDILHRLNELTIQGAHGVYNKDDLKAMGLEVNQLLNEMVGIANAKGADGLALFSGDRTGIQPFRTLSGTVPGGEGSLITQVDYIGTIGTQKAEVGENTFIDTNFPGNKVFWADDQRIFAGVDSQSYQVPADARILVDGKEISLRAGDNVHSILAKINDAGVSVKGQLDPVSNAIVLETTVPHQIWLQDGPGSTVLQDLGLLSDRGALPPNNLHADARAFGGSIFDAVIQLRDNLFAGHQEALGGRVLAGLQSGMNNLIHSMSELGSRDERLSFAYQTLDHANAQTTERLSQTLDLDITEGITNLKMMEYTHRAALGAAAKVMTPTLMDFLR